MSRTTSSSAVRVPSPVKYYLRFKGSTGEVTYWNGSDEVALGSIDLVFVDRRSSVGGWSDEHQSKIYSNMVKSTKEELVVKTDGKELIKGVYADIKAAISDLGGKFVSNIFAIALIDGEYAPVNLQFSGSSLSAWSDFIEEQKIFNLYNVLLTVSKNPEQKKKGAVKFYVPQFAMADLPEDMALAADDFDRNKLQPYLTNTPHMDDGE